jgi:two-component system, OmpR family, response regulator
VLGVRLLIVEDDPGLARVLERALERDGHVVDTAHTGDEALWLAGSLDLDAIVMDVNIPPPDGLAICARLRDGGDWTPILLLTSRGDVEDRVRGLDAGADDYLGKPFAMSELRARLRALVRRQPSSRPSILRAGDLSLDPATREVRRGEETIELSPKEHALLELFLRRAGEVLSRDTIREQVWDFAFDGDSNVVSVYVRYLRNKIDRPFGLETIETVRGIGYRLRAEQPAHQTSV